MNREIRHGKWLQISGRVQRAFGKMLGDDRLTAQGDSRIVAGALEETLGVGKQQAVDGISRGVDRFAATTKRLVRNV